MSTHKHIDKICLVAALLALVLCAVFMNGEALGIQAASRSMGYEDRLFDTSRVHTIDIIIDDWEAFLETARSEEYSICSVVIDGEAVSNVGIRGKGNTSLSNVASMDSDRYSFKIEFDQYDSTKTYHGLDKLSLNNIIQDNTYMKDYLSYQMMGEFGVPAPLCSYAFITVNGEDWGLYLAVEAVEEAFLQRNYGSNYGDLYKPDSMDMGGGRGNGKDFEMPDLVQQQENTSENADGDTQNGRVYRRTTIPGEAMNGNKTMVPGNAQGDSWRNGFSIDEDAVRNAFEDLGLDTTVLDGLDFDNISMETIQSLLTDLDGDTARKLMQSFMDDVGMQAPGMVDKGGFGGMGSSQTKLQYIDDDPSSYSTIFESAKTSVTDADQSRLIASLKQLSEYENLDEVVNIDDVLRYFVVHNYVVNGDSYTGSMIHNYYLYEENGRLSMVPWDYNLAFGSFQSNSAASAVNDDIDDVLSDRPMQAWIFSDETYSRQYYTLYAELLEQVDVQAIIDHAGDLIAPYVEKDPTAFCTYEEFLSGVAALKEFCALRTESVRLQLAGSNEAVDTGTLDLTDLGTMGGGMGGGRGGRGDFTDRGNGSMERPDSTPTQDTDPQVEDQSPAAPGGAQIPERGNPQLADGVELTESVQPGAIEMPSDMSRPDGTQRPAFQGGQTEESQGDPSGNAPAVEMIPPLDSSGQLDSTLVDAPFGQISDSVEIGESRAPSGSDNGMMSPGNMGDRTAGQGGGGFPISDHTNTNASSASSRPTMILLAVSAAVLAVGLVIAKKYRR